MNEELNNFIKVWFSALASLCYCYFISSRIPKGKLRLLSLLPVLSLLTVLPLLLSAVLSTGVTSFFLTWLCSFKLLLFSFDLGPLSPPKPLFLFLLLACFPIKISPDPNYPSRQKPKLRLNLPAKILLAAALIGVCEYREALHPKLLLFVYCLFVYLLVDVLLGLTNAAARAALGVELESPSDEPYLSTSLQDFWGRRWNLMVTNALRHTVYMPVRAVLGNVLGGRGAQAAAVMATFVVSGVVHEVLYYYLTRECPTWEVTWFFVLHGACVVVEGDVKRRALGGGWRLNGAVSVALTVAFLVVTAEWLFFAPLMRSGVDVRTLEELKGLFILKTKPARTQIQLNHLIIFVFKTSNNDTLILLVLVLSFARLSH